MDAVKQEFVIDNIAHGARWSRCRRFPRGPADLGKIFRRSCHYLYFMSSRGWRRPA